MNTSDRTTSLERALRQERMSALQPLPRALELGSLGMQDRPERSRRGPLLALAAAAAIALVLFFALRTNRDTATDPAARSTNSPLRPLLALASGADLEDEFARLKLDGLGLVRALRQSLPLASARSADSASPR